MDQNGPRDNGWPDQPDTYWRRRVFALAAGLGVLGLLAWAFSGALGGPKPLRQTTISPASAAAQQAVASSSAPPVVPSTAGSASATVTAAPSRKPNGAAAARPGAPARRAASANRPGGRCVPGDVVPSLFVSQQTYQPWVRPQFSIYLVNIGHGTCTFDVGARSLRLVVGSGQVRVWGSADCAHGATPDVVRLRRGVPFVTYLTWNRRRSSPASGSGLGCGSSQPKAAPGTYTVMVTSGVVRTRPQVFVLR